MTHGVTLRKGDVPTLTEGRWGFRHGEEINSGMLWNRLFLARNDVSQPLSFKLPPIF